MLCYTVTHRAFSIVDNVDPRLTSLRSREFEMYECLTKWTGIVGIAGEIRLSLYVTQLCI